MVRIPGDNTFEVPAIVAGTPHLRNFRAAYPGIGDPYHNRLKPYNGSAAMITIRTDKGDVFRIRSGDFVDIEGRGPIRWYTIDADANTSANQVEVYEDDDDVGAA